jgi:lipopolysaccharide heptosyltransferase II
MSGVRPVSGAGRAAPDPRWREARRVLAVRLDNLGDVLLCTPALRAVKESLPGAHLTLLASPVGAQAGRLNPDVDAVIEYEAPWTDPWRRLPHDSARERRMIRTLREGEFDGAIIFSSFRQSPLPAAYLCYLADIPLRVAASIDGPGSLLTTRHKHPERPLHEVERGLDLVGSVGLTASRTDLVLRVPPAARHRLASALGERGVRADRPLIVVHPGCTMPARTYPPELYAEVADGLIEELGASVVLTGAANEGKLLRQVRDLMRSEAAGLAGELGFGEFCALVEKADVLVTNNTGPMHIAAALKTPVVALFALTNPPEQWRPWRVPHRLLYRDVPCRLCYSRVCPYGHECLREVPPSSVVEAARELLEDTCLSEAGLAPAMNRPFTTEVAR